MSGVLARCSILSHEQIQQMPAPDAAEDLEDDFGEDDLSQDELAQSDISELSAYGMSSQPRNEVESEDVRLCLRPLR